MKKQLWIPMAAVLMMTVAGATAYADLTAAQIVNHFNAMNGSVGFKFSNPVTSRSQFTTAANSAQVDISAYGARAGVDSAGQNYFQTLCVAPSMSVTYSGTAKLSTNGVSQIQLTAGANPTYNYLSVGGAYMYKLYGITGDDNGYLTTFIQALNAASSWSEIENNSNYAGGFNRWVTSLRQTLSSNNLGTDMNYWLGNYNANTPYAFMGSYYVFAMDIRNGTIPYQSFFYLTNVATYDIGYGPGNPDPGTVTPPGGAPEPATLLLWSLGGMGMIGSWARQRRMKKLACS